MFSRMFLGVGRIVSGILVLVVFVFSFRGNPVLTSHLEMSKIVALNMDYIGKYFGWYLGEFLFVAFGLWLIVGGAQRVAGVRRARDILHPSRWGAL
jgi:hypothetical protein